MIVVLAVSTKLISDGFARVENDSRNGCAGFRSRKSRFENYKVFFFLLLLLLTKSIKRKQISFKVELNWDNI